MSWLGTPNVSWPSPRTVEYLWCAYPGGLYNYAELANYIEYDAGWIVDPADEAQIRQVAREILNNPVQVRRRGKNAQQLVRERLTWNVTMSPWIHTADNHSEQVVEW